MAPPSTIMPVGALCEGSQGGNRFSSGKSSAVPTGNPLTSSSKRMLATQRRCPALAYRVHHNKRPQIRRAGIKLEEQQRSLGFLTLENTFDRDSPDDCRSAMNIRVFRPYYKTDASSGRLPTPRVSRTVVEWLMWLFSLAVGRPPPVDCL